MSTVQQPPQTDYERLVWEVQARVNELRYYHEATCKNIEEAGGDIVAACKEYRAHLDNVNAAICAARDFQHGVRFKAMATEKEEQAIAELIGEASTPVDRFPASDEV